jgi:hypothetical protein
MKDESAALRRFAVTYVIDVPDPMQDEIRSWGLSLEAEDELYARLEPGLTSEELEKCWRLAVPSPTYAHYVDFQDPVLLGVTHSFTFYLTFGEKDDTLYIRDGQHTEKEDWEPFEEDI